MFRRSVHLKILLQSQQQVSINSTSYKGSDQLPTPDSRLPSTALAVSINSTSYKGSGSLVSIKHLSCIQFPLIPLPIKEAVVKLSEKATLIKSRVSINSTSYKGSGNRLFGCHLPFKFVSINSTSYKGSGKLPKLHNYPTRWCFH